MPIYEQTVAAVRAANGYGPGDDDAFGAHLEGLAPALHELRNSYRSGGGSVAVEWPPPILWGMPGPEAMELSAAGEIVLGGCVVDVDSGPPNIECSAYGTRWQVAGGDESRES